MEFDINVIIISTLILVVEGAFRKPTFFQLDESNYVNTPIEANFKARSSIECILKSLMLSSSTYAVFHTRNMTCLVRQKLIQETGKIAVEDTAKHISVKLPVHRSCRAMFEEGMSDGVYLLSSGYHFCAMKEIPACGGGGWTLIMNVNGSATKFMYHSPLWENSRTHNEATGVYNPLHVEAKYPGFSQIGFKRICVSFMPKEKNSLQEASENIIINMEGQSFQQLMKGKQFHSTWKTTTLGSWLRLVPGFQLLEFCRRRGLNVNCGTDQILARIGIVFNALQGCRDCTSFIGVGLSLENSPMFEQSNTISAGSGCSGDVTASTALIYIQ